MKLSRRYVLFKPFISRMLTKYKRDALICMKISINTKKFRAKGENIRPKIKLNGGISNKIPKKVRTRDFEGFLCQIIPKIPTIRYKILQVVKKFQVWNKKDNRATKSPMRMKITLNIIKSRVLLGFILRTPLNFIK